VSTGEAAGATPGFAARGVDYGEPGGREQLTRRRPRLPDRAARQAHDAHPARTADVAIGQHETKHAQERSSGRVA
jgi:hypothetical protein